MMPWGTTGSEGLDGIAGAFFFCLYELQVKIHALGESSCRQEFRVEWTCSSPSSVLEPGHVPGLPGTASKLSFEQSRVPLKSPQAVRNQENKIRYWPSRVSWGAQGAKNEAGSLDESCSLHTQSTDPILFCHCCHSPFLEIVLGEEKQWFQATHILEGLKKIFILSKAKWLRLLHAFRV